MAHSREPVKHTCPEIDDLIKNHNEVIKTIKGHDRIENSEKLIDIISDVEHLIWDFDSKLNVLRRSNDSLREWRSDEAEKVDDLEQKKNTRFGIKNRKLRIRINSKTKPLKLKNMSIINKSLAQTIAEKLTSKKQDEINEIERGIKSEFQKAYEAAIPKEVMEFFRTYAKFMNTTSVVCINDKSWGYEYFGFDKYLPEKQQSTALIVDISKIRENLKG